MGWCYFFVYWQGGVLKAYKNTGTSHKLMYRLYGTVYQSFYKIIASGIIIKKFNERIDNSGDFIVMSEFEKVIRRQQELMDRLNCSGAFSALKVLEENPASQALRQYQESIDALHENEALCILREETERTQNLLGPLNSCASLYGNLNSVLDSYRGISELTCVSSQVAELIEPLSVSKKALQNIAPAMDSLSKISSLTAHVFEEPSLLTYLHEVIESQIDTSLWDYYDSIDDAEKNFDDETVEKAIEIIQSPDVAEQIGDFLRKYGEKGKQIIAEIVVWITLAFLSGFVGYCCEPIYKILTPSFLRQEESIETTELTEIPVNTEIHVWNEVVNNFIEITYQINGEEYQGYITREELENNAELVSDKVTFEQICFINDYVEALAEKWGADPDIIYEFLNEGTNIINTYILKHYDVLKFLDEGELVSNLEEYCKQKGIVIPFIQNNTVEETK